MLLRIPCRAWRAAAELTDDAVELRYCTINQFHCPAFFVALTRASTLPDLLEAEASWGGDAALVAMYEEYRYEIDGPVQKKLGAKVCCWEA